jgi:ribonuclease HI
VKCNVHTSFIEEEQKGAWGAVLRDQDGNRVCPAWGIIAQCSSEAEGIAYVQSLDIVLQFSSVNLIIETDCSVVIEAFKDSSADRSELCIIGKELV